MLGCEDDSQCGPEGFCLSPTQVQGIPMSLCLAKCKEYYDCRYGEGYVCFGAEELGETRVCLPLAVVYLLTCGDGKCDTYEKWNPEACPEDCK